MKPTIKEIKTSKGKGYEIQVKYFDNKTQKYKYRKTTYYPEASMTSKQAYNQAIIEAEKFQNEIMQFQAISTNALDGRKITLAEYSKVWLEKILNEKSHSFYYSAGLIVNEMNQKIGHIKLRDLNVQIIQEYFNQIDKMTKTYTYVVAKENFKEILYSHNFKFRQTKKEMCVQTLLELYKGKHASVDWANRFCQTTGIHFNDLFEIKTETKELAHATKLSRKKVLRQILALAKRQGLVENNYATADYIEYPKSKSNPIPTMNEAEMKELYDAIMAYPEITLRAALLIFYYMGFRKEEVAGLEWDNINFENNTITVNKAVIYTPGFGVYEKETKTELSKREVSASKELMDVLKEYKEYLINNNIFYKKLFTHPDGTLYQPDVFNKWLRRIYNYSNVINRYTLHSIRHTNLSYLISCGVDPVTVAKRAGHSRVSTTLDIYSYAFNHIDREAANLTANMGKEVALKQATNNDVDDYKKVKEEMDRLGFKSYDECYDYLDFINVRNKRMN